MAPDRYTELFFLDEATGLAAGHRPASSAGGSFHAFVDAWAVGTRLSGRTAHGVVDRRTAARREVGPGLSKRTYRAARDLPDGVFVA